MSETITVDDVDVEVECLGKLRGRATRYEIRQGTRTWRVDVSRLGEIDFQTVWEDGEMIEAADPEWLSSVVGQLQARG